MDLNMLSLEILLLGDVTFGPDGADATADCLACPVPEIGKFAPRIAVASRAERDGQFVYYAVEEQE